MTTSCVVSPDNLAEWQTIGIPVRFDVSTVTPFIVDRSAGRNKNVHNMVTGCLQLNRIPYCKAQLMDCGTPTSSTSDAATGLRVANEVGGVAATALTGVPIGGGGPGLLSILAGIFSHHAQAVAKEQETLCQVSTAYNQFADQIEQMLKTGQIALQDAIVTLQKVYYQLVAQLNTIEGPGTSGCNAGCFYHSALDALLAFNKKYVYPSLVPSAQAVALPGTSSAQPPAGGTAGIPATSGAVLIGAIGYGLTGVH